MPESDIEHRKELVVDVVRDVIGDDRIVAEDNFFAAGGDSILALRVLAGAADRGLSIDVVDILTSESLAELAFLSRTAREPTSDEGGTADTIDGLVPPAGAIAIRPAGALQVGLLFLSEMARTGTGAYLSFTGFRIGPVDLDAFRVALDRVVERHEAMRSAIDLAGHPVAVQVVYPHAHIELEITEAPKGADAADILAQWRRQVVDEGIDVGEAPPLRCHVLVGMDAMWISFATHHSILDGWSFTQVLVDLLLHYDAALVGERADLAEVPAGVSDQFVHLEREVTRSPRARSFWDQVVRRTGVRPASDIVPCATRQVSRGLSPETWAGLEGLAAAAQVPIKSLCLAVHARAAGRVRGESWISTGLVTNGRPEVHGAERVVGLFLNTVPIVLATDGPWYELARAALDAERAMYPWRRYPLATMTSDQGGHFFDVTFNFTHFHSVRELTRLTRTAVDSWWTEDVATFPLMVDVHAEDPMLGTGVMVSYDPSLVDERQAIRLLDELEAGFLAAADQTSTR